jgi:hypothetical protein
MPWVLAKRLFGSIPTPNYGDSSYGDAIQAFTIIRAISGIIIADIIYSHFHADEQYVNSWGVGAFLAIVISMGITILLTAIVTVRKRDFSKEGWQPAIRAAAGLIALAGIPIKDHFYSQISITAFFVGIAGVWYAIFLAVCLIYWIIYPFGTSSRYPFLGPIVTALTLTIVTLISLIEGYSGPAPLIIWIGVTLAGASTALALVAVEIHLLRRYSKLPRQPFLIAYYDAQGVWWGVMLARSATEITRFYPELVVMHNRPSEMADNQYEYIRMHYQYDIDDPPRGMLSTILTHRQQKAHR